MSLALLLSLGAAASGIAAIASDWDRRRPAFYLFKPLTTALLIAVVALSLAAALAGEQGYRIGLLVAFGFCLLGDIALMFHGNRWFAAGLGAFLIGHVAFVQTFWKTLPSLTLPGWWPLLALYGIGFLAFLLPRAGKLAPAMLVYCAALLAMVLVAASRQVALGGDAVALTLIGALLFALSDTVLALRRFWRPFTGGQAATLSTYYLALGCIAWGG